MIRRSTKTLAALLSAFACATSFSASSPEEIAAEIGQQVQTGLQAYKNLQEDISSEKGPLLAEMMALEKENVELSERVRQHREIIAKGQAEIDKSRNDLQTLSSQNEYIKRSLDEYAVKFDSRIHLSESQRYFSDIDEIRNATANESLALDDRYALQLDAIKLGLDRIEGIIGGDVFDGKAIDLEGNVRNGKVAVLGPAGYFVDANNDFAGMLRFHGGTLEPEVSPLPLESLPGLVALVNDRSGSVPYDATLGDAVAIAETQTSFIEHLQLGGFVGYSILFLGAIAAIISLVKLADIKRFSVTTPTELEELARTAREDSVEAALDDAAQIKGVVGEMISTGLKNVKRNAVLLEETMLSVVLKKQPEMERFLPFLAITAAAAPLLGLLGTVVGLIKTFALITVYGAGTPKALSAGISEALVTTELGLMIAIPTLILHALFSRLIKTRLGLLEQIAFDFVKAVAVDKFEAKTEK